MKPKKRQTDSLRLRQAERLSRVLKLLERIQSRERWTVERLAAELDCSTRTVFRDLKALELAGVPYYCDELHCYHVQADWRFPVAHLTDEELIDQAAATAITSARDLSVAGNAKHATWKIGAVSREGVRTLLADAQRVVDVLGLQLADHSRHGEIIRRVQHALLARRQIAGEYYTPHQKRSVRLTLIPYRLCLVKQAWYLVAKPVEESRPKTYRIARFRSLKMLAASAAVPEEFSLADYFGDAWAVYRGETYDVELLFTSPGADLVVETHWHRKQEVTRHADGSATLRFHVDGLEEIVYWVLGWAGRVTVIQPPELRQRVNELLRQALAMNADENLPKSRKSRRGH